MSIDPDKPLGHACGENGRLKEASELDWTEPGDNVAHEAQPHEAQPAAACEHDSQTGLKRKFYIDHGPERRQMSSARKPSESSKRTNMTVADKLTVLDWITNHPGASQSDAAAHFKLQFPTLNQSTISRIICNRAELIERGKDLTQLSFKRPRQVEHPELDEALKAWCLQTLGRGIKLSSDLIRAKAVKFQNLLGIPVNEMLTFSGGWLEKFKSRLGLKEHKLHGEAGSVSSDSVERALIRLRKITDEYPLWNIFNFDETGLFYRMPPDRGLVQKITSGLKGDKTRITYGLMANADGSEKWDPLIIGKYRKPRAFQNKDGRDLGYDYYWNTKAWMTAIIWHK